MIQKSLLGQHCVLQSIWSMLFPKQAVPPQDSSWSFVRPLCLVPPSQVFVQELHGCQLSHSQSAKNLNFTKRFFSQDLVNRSLPGQQLLLQNLCSLFDPWQESPPLLKGCLTERCLSWVPPVESPPQVLSQLLHVDHWSHSQLTKIFLDQEIYDWKMISICSSFVRVVKGTRLQWVHVACLVPWVWFPVVTHVKDILSRSTKKIQ